MRISSIEGDRGDNLPQKPTAISGSNALTPPIIGGRRSLREIPRTEKPRDTVPAPSGSRVNDELLEDLRRQPPHCRELIRKRAYHLLKCRKTSGAISDTGALRKQGLDDQQYDLLRRLGEEALNGNTALIRGAWLVDYVEVPPSIGEFIWDHRFLGETYQPEEGADELFPVWKETLERDFDLDSEIHQLVLTGALAIGKTTVLVLIILYRLCLATMLQNPHKFFGVGRVSRLVFVLLSVTKPAARETAFHEVLNRMRLSPYFLETCGVSQNAEYAECRVEMKRRLPDGRPCNVFLTAGSRRQDLLGRNVLGVGLDEGNFRLEKQPDRSAYDLYSEITSRMAGRFQQSLDYQPTISIIASSAGNEWSFTEAVIKEIVEANAPHTRRVYRFAVYAVKRHLLNLDGTYFRVAYGIPNCDPVILSGYCTQCGEPATDQTIESSPFGARIEIVPRLFEEHFRRNCRCALQEFSGISTGGTRRAFSEMCHFHECIELGRKDGLREPERPGVMKIPLTMDDNLQIWDYLVRERFFARNSGCPQPVRHSNSKRYAHIDLATRSTAGVAVCHLVNAGQTGVSNGRYQLVVEYDFILALGPGRKPPIYIQKIINFFFWLRDECGFRFGKITADQFQSEMLLQTLQGQGLTTGHLSVDGNKSVYETWRNAIEGHQIRLYHQGLLLKETEFLQELDRKFDHPVGGSKDLADAAAGAYFNAILSEEKTTLSVWNEPAIYGIAPTPIGHDAALTDFGILQDYMRRNPRGVKVFRC